MKVHTKQIGTDRILDYRLVRIKIVGESLLSWAEVPSITSAWGKRTPLSETEILLLWESDRVRSIQFFRNGEDRV
jgi:hypothetical protein